jgi:hypothetical protein
MTPHNGKAPEQGNSEAIPKASTEQADSPIISSGYALRIPNVPADVDTITAAKAYADAGWYVVPVDPADPKNPGSVLGKGWQHRSSRDYETLVGWFAGANYGIALHAGRSGAVVIDMDHPELAPGWLLDALKDSGAPYQSSRIDADGRGHYICAQPPGRCLGNGVGEFKGNGFQIRGNNGVIIVAPSVHEKANEGGRYAWELTGVVPVLPDVIADKLPDATEATEAATDVEVTAFLEKHTEATRPALLKTWYSILAEHFETGSRHEGLVPALTGAMKEARAGFFSARDADIVARAMFVAAATRSPVGGEKQRTERQAHAEFESIRSWAVAQANAADLDAVRNRVEVKAPDPYFTGILIPVAGSTDNGATASEAKDRTAVPGTDPVGRYELAGSAKDSRYDPGTVEDEQRSDQGGSTVPRTGVLGGGTAVRLGPPYTDIVSLLDGTLPEPPKPAVLKRRDGNAIFYAGQINCLFGDPEEGKTFVALAAVVYQLMLGGSALIIDLDHNTAEAIVARLLMMGAPIEVLRDPDRFRYVEPDDKAEINTVVKDADDWKPTVVVVDSVGELLPKFRASSNSADEFTVVNSVVLVPLAKMGACVIAIDHLAKGAESRAHGPGGTIAKSRAFGGASIRVIATAKFTPGHGGRAMLFINKDRHGGLRAVSPKAEPRKEAPAGTFVLESEDAYLYPGELRWHIAGPKQGDRNPDDEAEPELVTRIEKMDPPPTSIEDARNRLRVNQNRAAKAYREWKTKQDKETQQEETEENS